MNDRCRLGEGTFAGMGGKEEHAPIPVIRGIALEPRASILSRHSGGDVSTRHCATRRRIAVTANAASFPIEETSITALQAAYLSGRPTAVSVCQAQR
jgi:hypothetical protein